MPPGGAEVLRSLLKLVEHVLTPQTQDIIHAVPVLRESVELRVIKLYRRSSHAIVRTGLMTRLEVVLLLGEVLQLRVALLPVSSAIEIHLLTLRQILPQIRVNVEVLQVQGDAGLLLHAQWSAGVLQSLLLLQPLHLHHQRPQLVI